MQGRVEVETAATTDWSALNPEAEERLAACYRILLQAVGERRVIRSKQDRNALDLDRE